MDNAMDSIQTFCLFILQVLRFLPFLNIKEQDGSQMARVISNQLTNVLATRVACLTIILVIVVPLLGLFQFPHNDFSIMITPKALVSRYQELVTDAVNNPGSNAGSESRILKTFSSVNDFYENTLESYGIYDVCLTDCSAGVCNCKSSDFMPAQVPSFDWAFQKPNRMLNAILVIEDSVNQLPAYTFQVSYNLEGVAIQDSWMNLALITLVIIVMVVFGLVLSNSVSDLALKPMERMLAMVREIAATVFKTVDHMAEEIEDIDSDDEDVLQASEMVLLERVVKKLALMAELQQRTAQDAVGIAKEDLKDEELGVLNLIQQNTIQATEADFNEKNKSKGGMRYCSCRCGSCCKDTMAAAERGLLLCFILSLAGAARAMQWARALAAPLICVAARTLLAAFFCPSQ